MVVVAERKKLSYKSASQPLPIKLSKAERRGCMKLCPIQERYVSTFSCLQCKSFEINSDAVRKSTAKTGSCIYPKSASAASRKITRWNPFNNPEEQKSEKGKSFAGELENKAAFAEKCIRKGMSRQTALKELQAQFSKISAGYASALYQIAKKKVGVIKRTKCLLNI